MIEFNHKQYQTDKHGYLTELSEWNLEIAEHIAGLEQIQMSDNHWEVVHFVRDFYQEYQTSPAIRLLVKAMKKQLGEEKGNSIYLYKLFPKGPAKQATRIAGLPKPAKCI